LQDANSDTNVDGACHIALILYDRDNDTLWGVFAMEPYRSASSPGEEAAITKVKCSSILGGPARRAPPQALKDVTSELRQAMKLRLARRVALCEAWTLLEHWSCYLHGQQQPCT
jgi:hypothetical protein